jgi:hypothetical protein
MRPPIPFFRPLGGRMGIELGPALVAVSSASARDEPDGRLHAGGAKTLELHPCTPPIPFFRPLGGRMV